MKAVQRAPRGHILDHNPWMKRIWIGVDARQVGSLEQVLAVAMVMVVVMVR